ncbi:MAG: hypothetical protein NT010_14135 [Proteobacteria bacterium]|jgi:hypothetical protein|nr:hypothetical protein [Pseudomonadota bacterium]
MESIELKAKGIDNSQFLTTYTKNIVEILKDPNLSAEVKDGQTSKDLSQLLESLGYHVEAKKFEGGWTALKAAK